MNEQAINVLIESLQAINESLRSIDATLFVSMIIISLLAILGFFSK